MAAVTYMEEPRSREVHRGEGIYDTENYMQRFAVRGDYRMPIDTGTGQAAGGLQIRAGEGWAPVTAENTPGEYDPRQDVQTQDSNERRRFNEAFVSAPAAVEVGGMQQHAINSGWSEPSRTNSAALDWGSIATGFAAIAGIGMLANAALAGGAAAGAGGVTGMGGGTGISATAGGVTGATAGATPSLSTMGLGSGVTGTIPALTGTGVAAGTGGIMSQIGSQAARTATSTLVRGLMSGGNTPTPTGTAPERNTTPPVADPPGEYGLSWSTLVPVFKAPTDRSIEWGSRVAGLGGR